MSQILFALCIFTSIVQIGWCLRRRGGILEYPFLVAWVYLFFVVSQMYRVSQFTYISEEAVQRTLLVVLFCMVSGFVGYISAGKGTYRLPVPTNLRSLKLFAIASVAFGALFHWQLRSLPEEMLGQSAWQGTTVAYLFLSRPLVLGGMLALALALKFKDRGLLGVAFFAFAVTLVTIVVAGRRGPLIEFTLAALITFFFVRGYSPPRVLAIGLIPIAVIFVNGIGIYRAAVYEGQAYGTNLAWNETTDRVSRGVQAVYDKSDQLLIPEECYEMTNATMYIDNIMKNGEYDFGTGLWDQLVHRFFPGQILGRDLKFSLQFNYLGTTVFQSEHSAQRGSTLTGFTDSVQAFWYFGCLFYYVTGRILRKLWNGGERGDLAAMLAYAFLIKESLESVTHTAFHFYAGLITFAIMMGIPLYLVYWITKETEGSIQERLPLVRHP
jgi:hypothetical protein